MPPTLFPRTPVKPGDEADCISLISGSWCKRLMRKPVVMICNVSSRANVEHVAAVRQPGGLRCPAVPIIELSDTPQASDSFWWWDGGLAKMKSQHLCRTGGQS